MEQGDAISRSAVLEKLSFEFDLAAEERADTEDEKEMAFNSGEMNCARRVTRFVKELNALDVPVITGETPVKKGRNNMKTKTTIAFSCPEKTAEIIDEYSARLGISRSACITMMCNAFLIADSKTFPAFNISDLREEAFDHERGCE